MKNLPIGEFLKDAGYITDENIKMALEAQKNDRTKRLGEHLINLGFVSEKQMLVALSKKLGDTMVELDRVKVDINAVKKIPKTMAEKYVMIAYRQENNVLTVVTNDPLNYYGIEDVRLVTGMNINIEIATKKEIEKAINNYYQEVVAFDIADDIQGTTPDVSPLELGALVDDDTPVVKLLNSLLNRGYNNGVSDIHIEPTKENLRIRMRIDGLLVDYINLNINILNSLVVRVKILANLNIAEKRVPQDGHFIIDIDGNDINMRVSTIPTVHGEKIVMRYLNNNAPITYADSFGMNDFNFEKMKSILKMPHGIIFVTGPTGSGKTTTLYMILESLAKNQINISTVEDPVERTLERINQTQVNPAAGLTFSVGLRSLLRQDPDVIMIGEIRDGETASIAVRAAITGHLVLATLHTNDAISSITRIEDMGVEPYMISNSLVGVVAQRLIRKICPHCKEPVALTDLEKEELGIDVDTIYRGSGCQQCNNTGYKGRIAIHEIIRIDKTVKRMIVDKESVANMAQYLAENQSLATLEQQARQLLEDGVTSIEEMRKIMLYSD